MAGEKRSNITLIKKCFLAICGVTLILLLVVNLAMPDLLYHFLKPRMKQNVSVLTESVSTRASYLLHQNCQYLLRFFRDPDFEKKALLLAKEAGQADSADFGEAQEMLRLKLEEEKLGAKEPGSIKSTRNVIFLADWEESTITCREGMEKYRDILFHSDWYRQLGEELEEIEEAYPGSLLRCYSPVFEGTEDTEEFISFVLCQEVKGHTFFLFLIEPFSDFQALFSGFRDADITDYALVGNHEEVLFQNQKNSVIKTLSSDERKRLFDKNQNTAQLFETDREMLIGVRISYQIEQLKIAASLSKEAFLRPYQMWINCCFLIIVVFAVILVFLIALILRHGFRNLSILTEQMRKIRDYRQPISAKIQSRDEVGILADTFYEMMEEIKKQEEGKKQIEYSLMVSQIDPHFIYNTLHTITYLAELNQTEDIMILNRALIGMLKDRLKISKLQAFDTLKREKQQLEDYITIQSYLCSNCLSMEFAIKEECENLLYPKNVFQPFVENSILHGILLHRDEQGGFIPGQIRIRVWKENGSVVTEIWDNGVGMSQEQIQLYFYDTPRNDSQGEHIGIHNIRIRMAYLFGEDFRIWAKTPENGGLLIGFSFKERKNT